MKRGRDQGRKETRESGRECEARTGRKGGGKKKGTHRWRKEMKLREKSGKEKVCCKYQENNKGRGNCGGERWITKRK